MKFPTISIRQPWAWAILHAGKDVENRNWRFSRELIGKQVLLHSSRQVDADAVGMLRHAGFDVPEDLLCGGIVGVMEFSGITRTSSSRWAEAGAWHWEIRCASPIRFFRYRGQLRFFDVLYPHVLGTEGNATFVEGAPIGA